MLTPAQVSSLVGAAHTLPIGAGATGSTCMFQNNDRVLVVLMSTVSSAEGARKLFDIKKHIVDGIDVVGWSVPAYAGAMKATAVVGLLFKQTLAEIKLRDPAQTPEALGAKLLAVMKDVAAKK